MTEIIAGVGHSLQCNNIVFQIRTTTCYLPIIAVVGIGCYGICFTYFKYKSIYCHRCTTTIICILVAKFVNSRCSRRRHKVLCRYSIDIVSSTCGCTSKTIRKNKGIFGSIYFIYIIYGNHRIRVYIYIFNTRKYRIYITTFIRVV